MNLRRGNPRLVSTLDDDRAGVSELISRSDNGVDVALFWKRNDNTAVVVVVDHLAGDVFLLHVREDDNPLDVFHHPFSYRTRRDSGLSVAHGEASAA